MNKKEWIWNIIIGILGLIGVFLVIFWITPMMFNAYDNILIDLSEGNIDYITGILFLIYIYAYFICLVVFPIALLSMFIVELRK